MPFTTGSSWHRNRTQVSCIAGRFFTVLATGELLKSKSEKLPPDIPFCQKPQAEEQMVYPWQSSACSCEQRRVLSQYKGTGRSLYWRVNCIGCEDFRHFSVVFVWKIKLCLASHSLVTKLSRLLLVWQYNLFPAPHHIRTKFLDVWRWWVVEGVWGNGNDGCGPLFLTAWRREMEIERNKGRAEGEAVSGSDPNS